ncbi:MAG: EVE domain-containing protein [Bacteroidales bacterium]
MNHWLIKSEPKAYSWDRFVKEKKTIWDGVRNYQARNNMKEMKEGDQVLFYHSVSEKAVVGIAEVTKEFFPDPTTDDSRWVVVELKPLKKLNKPVSLEEVKKNKNLQEIALIKQARLSVMPLKKKEFDEIVNMGK